MVIELFLFVLGIFFLIKGADLIVDSASVVAKRLGVSTMIVGLTIVAFGTSLPELAIGIFSSISGNSGVIFGNIIGASIANILLILGLMAILGKVKLKTETVWRQIPFALLAAFILFLFSSKTFFGLERAMLGRIEGIIFLSLLLFFFYSLVQTSKKEAKKPRTIILDFGLISSLWDLVKRGKDKLTTFGYHVEKIGWKVYVKFILGIAGIYFGGQWVVDGVATIAIGLNFSEYLISATVLSLGTTLPELTVSIFAVLRKKIDLGVGNAIGSVIFNILGVFGVSALVSPLPFPTFISIDLAIMFFATLLLFAFMFTGKKYELKRSEGIIFVLSYLAYIIFLIIRG